MISPQHQCVFVHIPKCGGQSIEYAFLKSLGLGWHERGRLLLRSKDKGEAGPPRLAHLTARDYVGHGYISEADFNAYFSCAIVRNPWARAVSLYHYLRYFVSFERFIEQKLSKELWRHSYWFVRPQTDFVIDRDGGICVDFIGRLETIVEDFAVISEKVGGLPALERRNVRSNASANPSWRERYKALKVNLALRDPNALFALIGKQEHHGHWRDYYNERTKRTVAALYAEDIDRFGYEFDG